jgi:hypothetical protein
MSIIGIVENGSIKLPPGVHVPDGTRAEVILKMPEKAEATAGSFFESIRDLVGSAEGLPEDFAAEHDHYIHGTPKSQ